MGGHDRGRRGVNITLEEQGHAAIFSTGQKTLVFYFTFSFFYILKQNKQFYIYICTILNVLSAKTICLPNKKRNKKPHPKVYSKTFIPGSTFQVIVAFSMARIMC